MKHFLFIAASLILLHIRAEGQTLNVHEWGTFTTLHGSTGGTLSGLYFEEENLPPFVYHFPGFAPDSNITKTGYRPCNNVTVKMETPVLYFYSDTERQVQVHVDFPMGTISQWYPNRSGGEETPVGIMDFAGKRTGSIDWNATILSPTTTEKFTQQTVSGFHKWTDPRNTASNLVKNESGEVEKYLFYRGLANVELPVAAQFIDSVHLSVSNTSEWDLPFIYIYDHTSSSLARIWGIGPLKSGEAQIFSPPKRAYGEDAYIFEKDTFQLALQKAGLTKLEAQAMLKTWEDGYFQTLGFKIFWIVPRPLTDQILPLKITPVPDTMERVLVGKTEILTPQFERTLLADYRAGRMSLYQSDRYRLAYVQRAGELQQIYDAAPKPLTVHGYGVLTSLRGSTGVLLSGLEREPVSLPEFIYRFPGFSPDISMKKCENVTIKMETPVLNFYSEVEKPVQVRVDFPMGSIPQWYPNRVCGEIPPEGDTIDFNAARRGSVQWNATVLPKNTEDQLTQTTTSTSQWQDLRRTDANLLKNEQGEVEKCLFYPGMANVTLPVDVKFLDSASVSVTNNSQWDIPFMYVYEHPGQYYSQAWTIGPLLQGETRVLNKAFPADNADADFFHALRFCGLTEKETRILLTNAFSDYSQASDFKIFWILPTQITDNILPLWCNPWPDTLERVFVGKTQILTPYFEKQLLDYFTKKRNLDQWKDDPYYFAYLERVKQIYKPIVINDAVHATRSSDEILISPNPASTRIHIRAVFDISSVEVRSVLGETVLELKNLHSPDFTLDLSTLVRGTYYIRFSSANSVVTKIVVRE